MSAGAFEFSRYEANYAAFGAIHPIRIQPETLTLSFDGNSNDAPSGAINNPISAISSRGRNSRGLKPRTVTLQFPATGQPTGYKPLGITTIPVLTQAFWTTLVANESATYLSVACRIVSKAPEEAD